MQPNATSETSRPVFPSLRLRMAGAAAAGADAIAGGTGFGVSIAAAAGRASPVRADVVRKSRRERGLDMGSTPPIFSNRTKCDPIAPSPAMDRSDYRRRYSTQDR